MSEPESSDGQQPKSTTEPETVAEPEPVAEPETVAEPEPEPETGNWKLAPICSKNNWWSRKNCYEIVRSKNKNGKNKHPVSSFVI